MAVSWEIIQFQSLRNERPVIELVKTLSPRTQSKVVHLLGLLSEKGYGLRMPYTKQLETNLYEIRIRGKAEVRILHRFFGKKIILLHAFIKKTQKTPAKEIEIAQYRAKQIS